MVFRFQSRQWASRPAIPVRHLGAMLGEALNKAANYRSVGHIMQEWGVSSAANLTEYVARQVVNDMMMEFRILQEMVEDLEKVRPEPKELLDFHVRAVGFLRGFLTFNDRYGTSAIKAMQGKDREAKRLKKESDDWFKTLQGAHAALATELQMVKSKYPHHYSMLNLYQAVDALELD